MEFLFLKFQTWSMKWEEDRTVRKSDNNGRLSIRTPRLFLK